MNQQTQVQLQPKQSKPFSYDNFPLFEELKRKETSKGIVCLDRVWWPDAPTETRVGGMRYSVTLNYKPLYSPASRVEAEEVYKSYRPKYLGEKEQAENETI
jgi:hypothetical protein